jgi:hypothetical protein
MSDPNWLGYIGAGTGIIGSVLGFIGYRQSREMKAVDLRLQLGQSENEARVSIEHLPALMALAKQSRTNVTSITGQTGALQGWLNSYASDAEAVRSLTAQLPGEEANYDALNPAALVDKVVTLHRLRLHAARLTEKYKASLTEDDKARADRLDEIRAKLQ